MNRVGLRIVLGKERSRQIFTVTAHLGFGIFQTFGQKVRWLVRRNGKLLVGRYFWVPWFDFRWLVGAWVAFATSVLQFTKRRQETSAVRFVLATLATKAKFDGMPIASREFLNVFIRCTQRRQTNFLRKVSKALLKNNAEVRSWHPWQSHAYSLMVSANHSARIEQQK